MKKILLATAAVMSTASLASAELALSGYGRFGWTDDGTNGPNGGRFETRMRINMAASVETDSGLTLSAFERFQADDGGILTGSGARFGVAVGGLSVQIGNISGAIESMPIHYIADLGLTGAGSSTAVRGNVDTYSSGGAGVNGVRVAYNIAGFNIVGSYSDDKSNDANRLVSGRTAVSASYQMGDWRLSAGNQKAKGNNVAVVGVDGTIGDFGVALTHSQSSGAKKTLVSGNYTMGASTFRAYVGKDEGLGAKDTVYGVGMDYDLGGASAHVGITKTGAAKTAWEAGLLFNF
ncbi:MAG: porin [Halocynthiibacter sp.]